MREPWNVRYPTGLCAWQSVQNGRQRGAIVQLGPVDEGRLVWQTGGLLRGYHMADGRGGWKWLGWWFRP